MAAWPTDATTPTYITRETDPEAVDKLKGSIARVPLYAGEPLRRSKLIGEGQSFMSSVLPSGKRAIATQISADTSAGGFILPNDYVDVIMTRRATQGTTGGEASSRRRFSRTSACSPSTRQFRKTRKARRSRSVTTATLELTPQQAEIITVAQQMADRLTLALRSITDTQEKPSDEADYLVSGNGRRGTVRLIKSGEVSEVGARK